MRIMGMMSGTSVDAVDVAIAEITETGDALELRQIWHAEFPWDETLRSEILSVLPPATSDVGTWCRLDAQAGQALGRIAAQAIDEAGPVDLVASHGQTLYHWVEEGQARGSLQIGSGAWIQAAVGVPVITDFRSADIAAGGQGAPLTSTFDALWLGDSPTAVLNLGGIANVTLVGLSGGTVTGDTGPANCLLDAEARRSHGQDSDVDGALALAGTVDEDALETLLADPFYAQPLPRSTGREHFHPGYVAARLGAGRLTGPDLFATLTELTARTVADVINAAVVTKTVASGGGMRNPALVSRLRADLDAPLVGSEQLGLDADAKEAYVFALLGYLASTGRPGTVARSDGSAVTGASKPVALGVRHPVASPIESAPIRTLTLRTEEES